MKKPLEIVHVITSLSNGGAQGALIRLVLNDNQNHHQVISLMDMGHHGRSLSHAGIPLHTLEFPQGGITVDGLKKLFRLIFHIKPDIVQTWLYHADLLGGAIARLSGCRNVVWGLRNSTIHNHKTSVATRFVLHLNALLSGIIPVGIVSCSQEAIRVHMSIGYRRKNMTVIPNGFDIGQFMPDLAARSRVRDLWGIDDRTILFGMVARWDPQKDHESLLSALSMIQGDCGLAWRCALVGQGMEESNRMLMALLEENGVRDRIILSGQRDNIAELMNGFDIHVLSSSYGEAFPNAVAEAMACGTPCITTDVGDSSLIVGQSGWVVPPSNSVALCIAMEQAMNELNDKESWDQRKAACRMQVVQCYRLETMVENYRNLWTSFTNGS